MKEEAGGMDKVRIIALNPKAVFFPVSAKTGEGLDTVCDWILAEVNTVKSGIL